MFDTHVLNADGVEAMNKFKYLMADAAREALEKMPEGRERAIFVTKLEEAVFFGAKAIASRPDNFTEVKSF